MQKIMREILIKKAKERLADGTVDRVFGWQAGEFCYDVTPAVFYTPEEMDQQFVFDGFCGANFSKYLIAETGRSDQKILAFLKPCDTYSFNQLLTEHRFDRKKVYAVAIPCNGMVDASKIRETAGAFASVTEEGDHVTVHTLYNGDVTLDRAKVLAERCQNCKSKRAVAYDEKIGDWDESESVSRFDGVKQLEEMTAEERFAFWQGELSRCIRCNACRDVCPACTCEKCVFDNPDSGLQNKAASDPFEEKLFHVIRAFHVAGRCTDCGECSRVCPQHIPLHLLNRKLIKDMNALYGDYQAGGEVGQRSPLVSFDIKDPEPGEFEGGGVHRA